MARRRRRHTTSQLKNGVPVKAKLGQPPFKPAKGQREMVRRLVGFGFPHERICLLIDNPYSHKPITVKTLKRAFPRELTLGTVEMDALATKMLTDKMRAGNMTAIIWYMKNKMGWRDIFEQTGVTPAQVVIQIGREELARRLEERGLPTAIFGVDNLEELEKLDAPPPPPLPPPSPALDTDVDDLVSKVSK